MPTPRQTSGFVSLGQYLDSNAGTINRERDELSADVGGQLDAAQAADDAVINAPPPTLPSTTDTTTDTASQPEPVDPTKVDPHAGQNPFAGQSPNSIVD